MVDVDALGVGGLPVANQSSRLKAMETKLSKGHRRMSVLRIEVAETVIAPRLQGAWPEEMDWYRRASFVLARRESQWGSSSVMTEAAVARARKI